MKKAFITCFTLFAIINSNAQGNSNSDSRMFDQRTGTLLYTFQYTDIQGIPFLSEDWQKANVVFDNGSTFKNLLIKVDLYNNKLIVNKNDTSFLLSPVVKEVMIFPVADTTNFLLFRKGYAFDKVTPQIYVQVLSEGKIGLLKYHKKNLEEYSEYNNANKLKRFNNTFNTIF
jgi:hypothetical protein